MPSPFANTNTANPLDGPINTQQNNNNNPLNGGQPQQNQPPANQPPGLPNSTNVPNETSQQNSVQSPLEKFKDIFETKPSQKDDDDNKSKEPEVLDFRKNLPSGEEVSKFFSKKQFLPENAQEIAEKALKGDAAALTELIQSAVAAGSSNAAHTALHGSAEHMNNNWDTMQNQTQSKTQTDIRAANLYGQLMNKYPHLNNEAIGPQVRQIVGQFMNKRGSQTDPELLQGLSDFIEYTYNAGNNSSEENTQNSNDEENWLSY